MKELHLFKQLGLSDETLVALEKKGFEEPSPIQKQTIPLLLEGNLDVVGQAQTGTGKTAAFGLPLIEKLKPNAGHVQALILAPTRELAIQVSEEINSLKGKNKLQIIPIYGGQAYSEQLRRLKIGVDIVVGTPGRIIDHINRGSLVVNQISYMILDEADEMLNMGFIEDIETILKATTKEKRMLLFSATMPDRILKLAEKYMGKYKVVRIDEEELTTNLTDQLYFEVSAYDKFEALCRIIDIEPNFYGLVFSRTKVDAEVISNKLVDRSYAAEALHGDISQHQRERILKKFKDKRINILVATDVAARGIDIHDLTHVINYSLPQDPESYVHRIGRTGRAGKEGTAITFVTPEEYRKIGFIKRVAKTEIRREKIPEVKDIIAAKKERIQTDIKNILEEGNYKEYVGMTKALLEDSEAENVISAILKFALQDELSERNYRAIKTISMDRKGKARLFVAKGKIDGMTTQKLLDFISKRANVPKSKLRDVQVYEKFSFVNVPFEEAEVILASFKRNGKGRRPLVERAKGRKN